MGDDRVAGLVAVARDDVEDARRAVPPRRARARRSADSEVCSEGLSDDGVAGDQRRRDLAAANMQRVVERHDPPDDARTAGAACSRGARSRRRDRLAAQLAARGRRSSAAAAAAELRVGAHLPDRAAVVGDVEQRRAPRRAPSPVGQRAHRRGALDRRRRPPGRECVPAAARTASSTSAAPQRGKRAITSPVAGLIASIVSPLEASRNSPPISIGVVDTASAVVVPVNGRSDRLRVPRLVRRARDRGVVCAGEEMPAAQHGAERLDVGVAEVHVAAHHRDPLEARPGVDAHHPGEVGASGLQPAPPSRGERSRGSGRRRARPRWRHRWRTRVPRRPRPRPPARPPARSPRRGPASYGRSGGDGEGRRTRSVVFPPCPILLSRTANCRQSAPHTDRRR